VEVYYASRSKGSTYRFNGNLENEEEKQVEKNGHRFRNCRFYTNNKETYSKIKEDIGFFYNLYGWNRVRLVK